MKAKDAAISILAGALIASWDIWQMEGLIRNLLIWSMATVVCWDTLIRIEDGVIRFQNYLKKRKRAREADSDRRKRKTFFERMYHV